jgi:hypothetical protein
VTASERDSSPVEGGWDFAYRLIERIASRTWTWSKTGQVALLIVVLAGSLAALAWTVHECTGFPGWAVGLGTVAGGTSLGFGAFRRRKRD